MLLDTASLYFRAFYGVPESVRAPDGTPVNAVRGMLDFTARLITDYRPDRLVACLDDDWRPEFRVRLLPSYKAHRLAPDGGEEVPDTLTPQVDVIFDVFDAVGLARIGSAGYEADDVIGTLATRASGAGTPVDIVTGDRDLFQLVDDNNGTRVIYTAKGVAVADLVDEVAVSARYKIPGKAYADFATLRGDASDGLPGVGGIGEKTAADLISRYGSLEGLLEALDAGDTALAAGLRRKLEAGRDYLAVAPAVVRVARDVPLADVDDALPRSAARPQDLDALVERWGLRSPVDRLLAALAQPTEE